MFDQKTFQAHLSTSWLAQTCRCFEQIDSTNTYLKKLPVEEISHGLLCLADDQMNGRGQYAKKWVTEPGRNLTFTLCFTPSHKERFHVLTLATALAIVRQIESELGLQATIKWPNDVRIGGKKVAGLLTETVFNGNRAERVLIGIGLNLNQTEFPEALHGKATSLCNAAGAELDREKFLASLLSRIEYEYGRWHKKSNDLLKEINQMLEGYGKWIGLEVEGEQWLESYKLIGINEAGKLLVVNDDGDIKAFSYEQIRLITN